MQYSDIKTVVWADEFSTRRFYKFANENDIKYTIAITANAVLKKNNNKSNKRQQFRKKNECICKPYK